MFPSFSSAASPPFSVHALCRGALLCSLAALVAGCGDYTIYEAPEKEGDDPGECSDLADNDEDGLFDCDDDECFTAPECQPNQLPSAPVVSIEPALPYTGDALSCQIDVASEDLDGDPVEYTVGWTVGGTDAGIEAFTVEAELTSRKELWTCSVIGWDGDEPGPPGTASVTVTNTPPPVPEVAIVPGYPTDRQDLICEITVPPVDPDDDDITYQYAWMVGGEATGYTESMVPWYGTAAYEQWTCHVTPHDGLDAGLAGEASAQVVVDGVQFVTTGQYHSCAVKQDGLSVCWGIDDESADDFGQVRNQFEIGAGEVVTGPTHTCLLKYDSAGVQCWGDNRQSQADSPVEGTFIQLSGGYDHNCGVKSNGQLWCWGSSMSWTEQPTTDLVLEVAAGDGFSCARLADGSIDCWKSDESTMDAEPPATPDIEIWTQITAGGGHACVLDTAGAITCWGDDIELQSTGMPESVAFAQVSAGHLHTCAVERTDSGAGPVHCWGNNLSGQSTPEPGVFTQVSAGWTHTCGRKQDYSVVCWGDDSFGQGSPPSF